MAANRNQLVNYVNSKLGLPYVYGGASDAGWDCSALMQSAYAQQGIQIPRVAQDQYTMSTKVSVDQLQPGDFVFFSDTGSTNNVTHVGMYIGDGKYTHAANSRDGVITSTLNTNGSYFVGAGNFGATGGGVGPGGYLKGYGALAGGGMPGTAVLPEQSAGQAATQYAGSAALGYEAVSFKDRIMSIVGLVVKALTIVLVFALAAIFFTKAFDIKIGGVPNA